jgi:hypothetical protein
MAPRSRAARVSSTAARRASDPVALRLAALDRVQRRYSDGAGQAWSDYLTRTRAAWDDYLSRLSVLEAEYVEHIANVQAKP